MSAAHLAIFALGLFFGLAAGMFIVGACVIAKQALKNSDGDR